MAYIFPYVPSRYYKRHRTYQMPDGSTLSVLTTRYTHSMGRRPCEGPRGGKAYREYPKSVYYADGLFYAAKNLYDEETGKWFNSLELLDGCSVWDCHDQQSREEGTPVAHLFIREGRAVSVTLDGQTMPMSPDYWPMCEELLHLDAKKRRSPRK